MTTIEPTDRRIMQPTNASLDTGSGRGPEDSPAALAEKIVFTMTLFPKITPSMLQVGIGPHIPPRVWRPIMEQMILQKIIRRQELGVTTPIGQYRTYTVLSLVNPPNLEEMMEAYRQRST